MRETELVLCGVVERSPYPKQDLDCFSSEFDQADPVCQGCRLNQDCQKWLGRRAVRVTLEHVEFSLVPRLLADRKLEIKDPDASNVQAAYAHQHGVVWPGSKPDRLGEGVPARLQQQADEARCSLNMFLLANMLGFKQANPDRQFYARMLVGESALRRVDAYRGVCRQRFGTFDEAALESLIGRQPSGLEQRLEESETIAAAWIIGWKIQHQGRPEQAMFQAKELHLDPVWLAIEPAYQPVLEAHRQDVGAVSKAVAHHRFKAARALVELKRNKTLATAAFELREKSAKTALRKALNQLGFDPSQFEHESVPITEPLAFYGRIGLAIQHLNCLNYVSGETASIGRFGLIK